MIVIDTIEEAVELFERRSGIYSSRYSFLWLIFIPLTVVLARPSIPMFDLMKLTESNFAFGPYSSSSTAIL
jgi:hypothetical protein